MNTQLTKSSPHISGLRFSLRSVSVAFTIICLILTFVGIQRKSFREEEKAANNLRERYLADIFHGVWGKGLSAVDEPPLIQDGLTPTWRPSQIEYGRLYLPNNTCWLGTYLLPRPVELDSQCADDLYRLPYLEELVIDCEEIEPATELDFARFTSLRRLALNNWGLSSTEIESIASLRSLESLVLDDCLVDAASVQELRNLVSLKRLSLDGAQIGNADLVWLNNLQQMQELSLGRTFITDEGLKELRNMCHLTSLNIQDADIQGDGLKHLQGADIDWLHAPSTQIDDKGLKTIVDHFPNLKYLNLSSTSVTDASLSNLLRLNSLEILSLSDTAITPSAIRSLRDNLHCNVYGNE